MKKARHGSRAFFDAEKSGGANGPQIIFVADLFFVLLIIGAVSNLKCNTAG